MSVRKLKCEVVVPFTANPKVDRKGMRAFCVGSACAMRLLMRGAMPMDGRGWRKEERAALWR